MCDKLLFIFAYIVLFLGFIVTLAFSAAGINHVMGSESIWGFVFTLVTLAYTICCGSAMSVVINIARG